MTDRERALIPKDVVTYYVTGFLAQAGGQRHPPMIVEERENGCVVNIYTAYAKGDKHLTLYPRKKVMPSTVPYTKKIITIFDTRRAY
jgi:hypothetical protein